MEGKIKTELLIQNNNLLIELLEKEVELKKAQKLIERQKKFIDENMDKQKLSTIELSKKNVELRRDVEAISQSRDYWKEKGKAFLEFEKIHDKLKNALVFFDIMSQEDKEKIDIEGVK